MKNLVKITTIWSLLISAGLLIGLCGGCTKKEVSNKGDITITVSDSSGAPLTGVLVQVRQTEGTGTFTDVGTTTASGQVTYTGTAGTDYFFTLSKAGFTTQTDIKRTPQSTSTVNLVVTLN